MAIILFWCADVAFSAYWGKDLTALGLPSLRSSEIVFNGCLNRVCRGLVEVNHDVLGFGEGRDDAQSRSPDSGGNISGTGRVPFPAALVRSVVIPSSVLLALTGFGPSRRADEGSSQNSQQDPLSRRWTHSQGDHPDIRAIEYLFFAVGLEPQNLFIHCNETAFSFLEELVHNPDLLAFGDLLQTLSVSQVACLRAEGHRLHLGSLHVLCGSLGQAGSGKLQLRWHGRLLLDLTERWRNNHARAQ